MTRRKQVIEGLYPLDLYYFIDYIDCEIEKHKTLYPRSKDRINLLEKQKLRAQNQIKVFDTHTTNQYVKVGSKYRFRRINEVVY